MKRYIIKKEVMAKSISEALKKERDIKPRDVWEDEKQPEEENTSQIGFDLPRGDYYSPYMKKKKIKKPYK